MDSVLITPTNFSQANLWSWLKGVGKASTMETEGHGGRVPLASSAPLGWPGCWMRPCRGKSVGVGGHGAFLDVPRTSLNRAWTTREPAAQGVATQQEGLGHLMAIGGGAGAEQDGMAHITTSAAGALTTLPPRLRPAPPYRRAK